MAYGFANDYKRGKAEAAQDYHDAGTLRANARTTLDEATQNETSQRYEYAQQLSDFTARMAARGISTTSDMFLNTYLQNVKNAETNIYQNRQKAINEAVDLRNQASWLEYNAKKKDKGMWGFVADPAGIWSGW
jgi:predicted amidohydrolase YtcJ